MKRLALKTNVGEEVAYAKARVCGAAVSKNAL